MASHSLTHWHGDYLCMLLNLIRRRIKKQNIWSLTYITVVILSMSNKNFQLFFFQLVGPMRPLQQPPELSSWTENPLDKVTARTSHYILRPSVLCFFAFGADDKTADMTVAYEGTIAPTVPSVTTWPLIRTRVTVRQDSWAERRKWTVTQSMNRPLYHLLGLEEGRGEMVS